MLQSSASLAAGSHWNRTLGISSYTLLEAWRNRFPVLVLAVIAVLYVIGIFVRELAITESTQVQTGFIAASARLAAVFIVALYVLQGLAREAQDKIAEIIFSLDLPRAVYVLGKFLGYAALCAVVSAICALPVLTVVPGGAALAWSASLMLELWLVAAASVFCMVTFSQLLPAATFVAGFYLLGRSITAIQLMSRSTLAGEDWGAQAAAFVADMLAFLLPRLDAFTQTAWLLGTQSLPVTPVSLAIQVLVYVLLLLAAAMFDLYRRNF
jgi:hypothetical protein